MRSTVVGVALGSLIGMIVVFSLRPNQNLQAQTPYSSAAASDGESLVAMSAPTVTGDQIVTVIDRQQRVMGVYLIESKSGEIKLKSVRNLRWDLMMDEYNGTQPLPEEIRALVQPR